MPLADQGTRSECCHVNTIVFHFSIAEDSSDFTSQLGSATGNLRLIKYFGSNQSNP
jgi:hypothetical protein